MTSNPGKSPMRRGGFASILVEPYKQVKIGIIFLAINLFFSLLIAGVLGYYVYDMYSAISYYFELSQQENIITLKKITVPLAMGAGLILLFIVTTLYVSIHYTHKIYGPLVSINRFIDELLQNKKPEVIQLRDSDQLKELADKLNELAAIVVNDHKQGDSIQAINAYVLALVSKSQLPELAIPKGDSLYQTAQNLKKLS